MVKSSALSYQSLYFIIFFEHSKKPKIYIFTLPVSCGTKNHSFYLGENFKAIIVTVFYFFFSDQLRIKDSGENALLKGILLRIEN